MRGRERKQTTTELVHHSVCDIPMCGSYKGREPVYLVTLSNISNDEPLSPEGQAAFHMRAHLSLWDLQWFRRLFSPCEGPLTNQANIKTGFKSGFLR